VSAERVSSQQKFDELLRAWSAAIVANDPDAIDRYATPDWVLVGATGVFPRTAFLDAVATGRLTHDAMTHEIHEVRDYGDVAIVLSRGRNHGTLMGDEFTNDEWVTDVFVRGVDGWRCSVTHLTAAAPD
jgi:ketosteroid isomerase-like protein